MATNFADGDESPKIDDDVEGTGETITEQPDAGTDGEDIGFGDDVPDDETAPEWVRNLRNENREHVRELAIARKRIAELDKPAAPVDAGPRPTREEFDWDDDKYDAAVDAWNERKLAAQTQANEPNDLQAEVQKDVQNLASGIASLTYADKDEIVPATMEMLTPEQQFIFASAAKEPAKLIYALGKNPSRMKALLDIKNPAKFIAEVARTEMQMTVRTRTAPQPELIRSGDARPGVVSDKELARLQKVAERTGDYSEVMAHKRKLREKA